MTGREGVMVTNWAEVERCCTGARKGHSTTNPSVCLAQSQLASHPAMLSLLIVSSSVTSLSVGVGARFAFMHMGTFTVTGFGTSKPARKGEHRLPLTPPPVSSKSKGRALEDKEKLDKSFKL